MNKLIILLFFGINSLLYSQTENLEIKNLARRYDSGEFSAEDYRQLARDWHELLNDMGGFPELPYDSVRKQIRFEYVFETGLSKSVVFNRILEWSAVYFGSLNHVLHYENKESGKIILKGNFDVTHRKNYKNFWGNPKEGISQTTCYNTYQFTIKDNKIKIEISNIEFEINYGGYLSANVYIPNRLVNISIHDLYPITDFDSGEWKEKLDLLNQTNRKITNIVNSMFIYIKEYTNDYAF
ncbi:MAG: DUF4468 domain-containing protein [Bacteroidales bacterium]